MEERFCALCRCKKHDDMPKDLAKNWACPILKAKVCKICCEIELGGGFAAQDTLRDVCTLARKTPQQVYSACVACRHGGRDLTRWFPGVIAIVGKDGKKRTTGREIERLRKHDHKIWQQRARWLKGDLNKHLLRRMNVELGFKP